VQPPWSLRQVGDETVCKAARWRHQHARGSIAPVSPTTHTCTLHMLYSSICSHANVRARSCLQAAHSILARTCYGDVDAGRRHMARRRGQPAAGHPQRLGEGLRHVCAQTPVTCCTSPWSDTAGPTTVCMGTTGAATGAAAAESMRLS
jgi:hypothetical protein